MLPQRDFSMIPERAPAMIHRPPFSRYAWAIAVSTLFSIASFCLAQTPAAPNTADHLPPPAASDQQPAVTAGKPGAGNTGNEKAKADAARLSTLADQLRDQLNKMNVNVLSLDVLQKTETIEKLARKIRGEADVR